MYLLKLYDDGRYVEEKIEDDSRYDIISVGEVFTCYEGNSPKPENYTGMYVKDKNYISGRKKFVKGQIKELVKKIEPLQKGLTIMQNILHSL